ncbi:MAG: hypothetical protein ACOYK4_05545 [Candidatus Planktophila sp.]
MNLGHHPTMSGSPCFDAIVFYYWLCEDEIDTIFSGKHKWWFMHGMGYPTCIFYGPTITRYLVRMKGPMRIVTIPLGAVAWSSIRYFLTTQGLSTAPILSIVVESGILPSPANVNSSKMPVQCLVADTHHMSNPITSALSYLIQIDPIHISVSHSCHRQIFSDCLGLPISPLVYSPRRLVPHHDSFSKQSRRDVTYYGSISDSFHPERTHIIESLLSDPFGKRILRTKPRMPPAQWEFSVSQDLASFTCSLNGFPSVQSYVPLIYGTCLISDHLSAASDLGKLLEHGKNCLLYSSPQEALDLLRIIEEKPDEIISIGKMGQETFYKYQQSVSHLLLSHLNTLSTLNPRAMMCDSGIRTLDPNIHAITACFAYEVIQEMHRLSNALFVNIQGDCDSAHFLRSYIQVLPRVAKVNADISTAHSKYMHSDRCVVTIANTPLDSNSSLGERNSILLLITQPPKSMCSFVAPSKSINPNIMLHPVYEGAIFNQALPGNISAALTVNSCLEI